MPMPKPCKWCKEQEPKHWPYQCRLSPKNIAKANEPQKPRKPIPKVGKVTKEWFNFRKEYLKLHPPNSDGKYECYLKTTPLCPGRMYPKDMSLDHVIPKGSLVGRQLKYNEDNLRTSCFPCNSDKGSQSLELYLEKVKKRRLSY
jgi:5-methylcytosine-specific restriction endonuclease McrA